MPDPNSRPTDENPADEAVEDEVLDIVTSNPTAEPRSFSGQDQTPQGAGDKSAKPSKDADSQPVEADEHVDKQLDHGLKETFPASDPVSINPGAD
jgi:hypothetical protein